MFLKNKLLLGQVMSAGENGTHNKPTIAALESSATEMRARHRVSRRPTRASVAILAFVLALAGSAASQIYDLGPHNIDGRGCLSCHVPHSPFVESEPQGSPGVILWGKELKYLFYTTSTRDTFALEDRINSPEDPVFHTVVCLACHDASIARLGMLGNTFEALTSMAKSYRNDDDLGRTFTAHPVHVPYLPNTGCGVPTPGCNPYHWPSAVDASGSLNWSQDTYSKHFTEIYGRSVRFYSTPRNGGQAMVECASCHDPHSLAFSEGRLSNGKTGIVPSRNFVRGWYDAEDKKSDSVSKFCRSCHYGNSNEFVQKKG
jgi:hypothetical protein